MFIQISNDEYKTLIEPYISDGLFDIDPRTREVSLKDQNNNDLIQTFYLGAEKDTNIQKVVFRIPRIIEGVDLTQATHAYVYIQGQGQEPVRKDLNSRYGALYYDSTYVYMVWTITNSITQFIGAIDFAICLQQIEPGDTSIVPPDPDIIQWEFNSQPTQGIVVATLHTDEFLTPVEDDIYENIDSWQGNIYAYSTFINISDIDTLRNTDNTLYINAEDRIITVPNNFYFGVETDHGVKICAVAFPKIIDGTDISSIMNDSNFHVYMTYNNANGESDRTEALKNNLQYKTWTEEGYIGYYFIVPIGITEAAGNVSFAFCFVYRKNGKIDTVFNTQEENAEVYSTVAGGERLTVMTNDQFEAKLDEKLEGAIQRFFNNNNVIIDGNTW